MILIVDHCKSYLNKVYNDDSILYDTEFFGMVASNNNTTILKHCKLQQCYQNESRIVEKFKITDKVLENSVFPQLKKKRGRPKKEKQRVFSKKTKFS